MAFTADDPDWKLGALEVVAHLNILVPARGIRSWAEVGQSMWKAGRHSKKMRNVSSSHLLKTKTAPWLRWLAARAAKDPSVACVFNSLVLVVDELSGAFMAGFNCTCTPPSLLAAATPT